MIVDESTDFGARAARHLREDKVAWLTTVTPSGAPLPMPVWFVWDGDETVVMYSRDSARVRNVRANPNVSLNFAGDGQGGDIVVLSGTAEVIDGAETADKDPGYRDKYSWGFDRLRISPEQFAARYPNRISIRLTRLRGH